MKMRGTYLRYWSEEEEEEGCYFHSVGRQPDSSRSSQCRVRRPPARRTEGRRGLSKCIVVGGGGGATTAKRKMTGERGREGEHRLD